MMCEAVEYHPYAACLMFKQCPSMTDSNGCQLQAVRDDKLTIRVGWWWGADGIKAKRQWR